MWVNIFYHRSSACGTRWYLYIYLTILLNLAKAIFYTYYLAFQQATFSDCRRKASITRHYWLSPGRSTAASWGWVSNNSRSQNDVTFRFHKSMNMKHFIKVSNTSPIFSEFFLKLKFYGKLFSKLCFHNTRFLYAKRS